MAPKKRTVSADRRKAGGKTPKKTKRTPPKEPTIRVGNISNVRGNLTVAGRDVITKTTTTTGLGGKELKPLFDQLYAAIEASAKASSATKEDLKAEVKGIQETVAEAAKENKKVDEGFLAQRFRNIARMAPDILEVAVATLGDPLAGLGVAAKKIAEKAKEETKAS